MIISIISIFQKLLNYYTYGSIHSRKVAEMEKYFSQAVDLYHLEKLERDWFKNNIL